MTACAEFTLRSRRQWLAALIGAAWAAAAFPGESADEAPIPENQLEDLLENAAGSQPAVTRQYNEIDFAPYFGSGMLAEAKTLFDRHRYARARAMLRGEEPPVRYLRALATLRIDPLTAASELRALADDYPQMRDYCMYHAASVLERLRKRSAAAAAYAEVSPGSTLYADARLRQSRVLERALDLDGALEALTPLRELPATPRYDVVRRKALLATARLYQKKGDYPGEHRAMLELWATSPLSREAETVWERLRELPIPNKWRLRRAESFLSFHSNAEAMRLARQVKTQLPDEHACRAAFVVGNALRKERQHRKAVAALAPMVEACQTYELRPQAMFVLGYSQSVVAWEDAVRTYEALAHQYPEHPFADDALFFAAELDLRKGRVAAALERLERVATQYAERDFASEALFKVAWQYRAAGTPEAVLAALDRLERLPGLGREQQLRVRYWKARTLAEKEKSEASAVAGLTALATEHPESWYGLLARVRLPNDAVAACCGGSAPQAYTEAPVSVWPLEAGSLGTDPHFLAGVELLRMGLPDAGTELLAANRTGLPEDAMRLLTEALQRAGRKKAAAAYVARAKFEGALTSGIENQMVWQAAYPRPFQKVVKRWANASRIDPDLLQALIREESNFNQWAHSSTGAIGLTQLMPATAREVARKEKLGEVAVEALHRPELNIRLGAAYLGELLSDLDGSLVHAVAAYNAGPEAVSRWVRAWPDADIDEWVEQIPITETRNYVKRVLGSYGAYRLVYSEAAAVSLAKNQSNSTTRLLIQTTKSSANSVLSLSANSPGISLSSETRVGN